MGKRTTEEKENKTEQVRVWFSVEQLSEMDEIYQSIDCPNRSEFIRDAVKFYMGYIKQNKNIDYLSPVLGSVIKSEISGAVRDISSIVFKLATEEAVMSNILAFCHELDIDSIKTLRENCAKTVASTNGILTFEEAYDWQRGDIE